MNFVCHVLTSRVVDWKLKFFSSFLLVSFRRFKREVCCKKIWHVKFQMNLSSDGFCVTLIDQKLAWKIRQNFWCFTLIEKNCQKILKVIKISEFFYLMERRKSAPHTMPRVDAHNFNSVRGFMAFSSFSIKKPVETSSCKLSKRIQVSFEFVGGDFDVLRDCGWKWWREYENVYNAC